MRLVFWRGHRRVVLALFAVERATVRSACGLPFLVELPLYVAVLAALAAGFLIEPADRRPALAPRGAPARLPHRRLEGELRATQAQLVGPAGAPIRVAARTSS
jgi:hypothetical protein